MAQARRSHAAEDDGDDGRADRRARSPTAVNNLAHAASPISWFEQNLIHRVPPKYPGYMRRVYPGFLQHLGFVAMNPDRHCHAHWDYFHHLLRGRRRIGRGAPALLRRVQRGARHAGRVLPRHGEDGVPGLRAAQGAHVRARASWCGRRRSATPRCSPSRASSTTSPATARPRPRTRCASTSRASGASTSSRPASATTASSPAAAGAR